MSAPYGLCTMPTINAERLEQMEKEEWSVEGFLVMRMPHLPSPPLFSTPFIRGTKWLMSCPSLSLLIPPLIC
ncbi:hypothetical protein SUGI_0346850 [Cryptomeria japonica]|nr:hypothetical protein SUGI_0346850 [Cryptomeria japonica]